MQGFSYIKIKIGSIISMSSKYWPALFSRCVPKSKCSNGGRKGNTCAVDLRSVDLRQDYDSEEEVVCCSEELIKSNNSCQNGYT